MSKYTTGEMAKLCGVTVRTVQYYDTRGLLVPSELSEGGRRLYSDEDLRHLKIICFLRDAGLSIETIRQILAEDHADAEAVIGTLIEEQRTVLRAEINERQEQVRILDGLTTELRSIRDFTVDSIGDIAHILENKKKLRCLRVAMLVVGMIMDVIEIATLVLWIKTGLWQPFAVGLTAVAALGVWVSVHYFRRVSYICPGCHKVFRPTLRKAFWAYHTPRARRLTCPDCGRKGFCVETYGWVE